MKKVGGLAAIIVQSSQCPLWLADSTDQRNALTKFITGVFSPSRGNIHITQRFNRDGTNHLPALHPLAILAPERSRLKNKKILLMLTCNQEDLKIYDS